MADQRLPIVNDDDGIWGDILRQYLKKEHTDNGTDNAANYVYTVYKNGTTQIVQWIDTGNVVTPGNWTAPAFGCSWNSGQRYGSHGATAFKTAES